ncbi:MAG: FxLYD domain-containing protein [Nitrososphaeraceae archaeon]
MNNSIISTVVVISITIIISNLFSFNIVSSFSSQEEEIKINQQKPFLNNNTSTYLDEFGYLHLYGEVINLSNYPINDILLNATFYDNENNILGKYFRNSEISTLFPNQSSPFEIIFLDTTDSKKVADYDISLSFNYTKDDNNKLPNLKITEITERFDISGFYYINGRIHNMGEKDSSNSTVIATLYDKKGNVIDLTKAITEPFTIPPNSNAAFSLTVVNKDTSLQLAEIYLSAESVEYVSR